MTGSSQKRALKSYRKRIEQRGMARFEVLGLKSDRNLIRLLAKRLAENDADAAHLRMAMHGTIGRGISKKGGVLAALRRSPLVGAELDLTRPVMQARDIDL